MPEDVDCAADMDHANVAYNDSTISTVCSKQVPERYEQPIPIPVTYY